MGTCQVYAVTAFRSNEVKVVATDCYLSRSLESSLIRFKTSSLPPRE